MRLTWTLAAIGVLALVTIEGASAQTTTNGLFGQNSVGGSAATRTPTASSSARTSTGTSAGGTSSGGSGGAGQATNVAQTAAQNVAAGAQTTQVKGAFVGADSLDTQNVRSLAALNGQTARQNATSGMNQLQNLFSQGLQQLNQQTQRAARPQIRVPMRMGFAPQPVNAVRVQNFRTNLNRLPGIQFIGPAELVMDGRTAVLKGVVASEDDRRLAETLAKMEPEILVVKNELRVDSTATRAEVLPPATSP